MKRIIRVFPRRTNYTPTDDMVFVGEPTMFMPKADEIHISCTFTWDKARVQNIKRAWSQYYWPVYVGGPAFEKISIPHFHAGRYVKKGVTFTSRGCNNQCPWCLVPEREGKLIEINKFAEGHIIQDNNLLQCSSKHIYRVIEMLKKQRNPTVFAGGLDTKLITDWFVDELRTLRINQLFLACDTKEAINPLRNAVKKLSFLSRRQLRCYVLIAYKNETIEQARNRLEEVWGTGCLPFAQLYQPSDHFIEYSHDWKSLSREWSRPAAIISNHK